MRRKNDAPRGVLRSKATSSSAFRNERYHPAADLEPWVEHHWTVTWDLEGAPPQPVATLPHPCVHLVFEEGQSGVAGPSRARFARELSGRGDVFAVKFLPAGFRSFVNVPVTDFADRVRPIHDVFGREGAQLEESVLRADATPERIALVEDFLRSRHPAEDVRTKQLNELVARAALDRSIVKVADLQALAGLGLRSLQRLFAEYVGVSPKWVIQRYRLHEAAERLAAGPEDHASLALEIGYADQSHFIRDFKSIVGVTPAAYVRAAGPSATPESPRG
ncbi:MAG: helix-turn-helix transcriptional regulator [Gemmatimonadetes bacterium]|nr:helix-turn-helix transcriptional regulator [Gemmatimonadota bacterium]